MRESSVNHYDSWKYPQNCFRMRRQKWSNLQLPSNINSTTMIFNRTCVTLSCAGHVYRRRRRRKHNYCNRTGNHGHGITQTTGPTQKPNITSFVCWLNGNVERRLQSRARECMEIPHGCGLAYARSRRPPANDLWITAVMGKLKPPFDSLSIFTASRKASKTQKQHGARWPGPLSWLGRDTSPNATS